MTPFLLLIPKSLNSQDLRSLSPPLYQNPLFFCALYFFSPSLFLLHETATSFRFHTDLLSGPPHFFPSESLNSYNPCSSLGADEPSHRYVLPSHPSICDAFFQPFPWFFLFTPYRFDFFLPPPRLSDSYLCPPPPPPFIKGLSLVFPHPFHPLLPRTPPSRCGRSFCFFPPCFCVPSLSALLSLPVWLFSFEFLDSLSLLPALSPQVFLVARRGWSSATFLVPFLMFQKVFSPIWEVSSLFVVTPALVSPV